MITLFTDHFEFYDFQQTCPQFETQLSFICSLDDNFFEQMMLINLSGYHFEQNLSQSL